MEQVNLAYKLTSLKYERRSAKRNSCPQEGKLQAGSPVCSPRLVPCNKDKQNSLGICNHFAIKREIGFSKSQCFQSFAGRDIHFFLIPIRWTQFSRIYMLCFTHRRGHNILYHLHAIVSSARRIATILLRKATAGIRYLLLVASHQL